MTKVVNIAVETVYQGKHYSGIVVHPGVSMGFEPMPCVSDKTRILFSGTAVRPNVFVDAISSVEECEVAVDNYTYLHITTGESA